MEDHTESKYWAAWVQSLINLDTGLDYSPLTHKYAFCCFTSMNEQRTKYYLEAIYKLGCNT